MKIRREEWDRIDPRRDTNAGLWLHKYLLALPDDGDVPKETEIAREAKFKLWGQLEDLDFPKGYRAAHTRYVDSLKDDANTTVVTATVRGRLVIGLGAKGAAEAGLHLDHTWGVPVLPGSALKGLAEAAARHLASDPTWLEGGNNYLALFGDTEESGHVVFHDAWLCPGDVKLPIHQDVMTVHHKDYYEGSQPTATDCDEPVPVPFGTVTGTFNVAVTGEAQFREAALFWLKHGLDKLGLGAKTNAGYGRMSMGPDSEAEETPPPPSVVVPSPPSSLSDDEMNQLIARISPGTASHEVQQALGKLAEEDLPRFAALVVKKLSRKWLKGRAEWADKLLALVGS